MIIFHEGLPGSGKSYEAMTHHVLAALKGGRKCFAYIDGVDDPDCRARVAELSGLTPAEVDDRWRPIRQEDLQRLHEVLEDNCFAIVDEAQNHWPAVRKPLSPEFTKFVSEHRHRGIDVLLMGQVLKDVHSLWKGRVDQLVVFNKLGAVGQENRYSIDVKRAAAPGKFLTVTKSIGRYDPKLFGMYKTVNQAQVSVANYKDARANVFTSTPFRITALVVAVVLGLSTWQLWRFFHPTPVAKPASVAQPGGAALPPPGTSPAAPGAAPAPSPVLPQAAPTFAGFVRGLNAVYRPRLALVATYGGQERGVVEWWDGATVRERFTFAELRANGVVVTVASGVAHVGGAWVTAWRPPEPPRGPYGADAGLIAAGGISVAKAVP